MKVVYKKDTDYIYLDFSNTLLIKKDCKAGLELYGLEEMEDKTNTRLYVKDFTVVGDSHKYKIIGKLKQTFDAIKFIWFKNHLEKYIEKIHK